MDYERTTSQDVDVASCDDLALAQETLARVTADVEDSAVEAGALEDGAATNGAIEDGAIEDGAIEDSAIEGSAPEKAPADPFADVPQALRRALEGRGFTEMSAVQRAVLATDAEGRDLQISSQTGSGKTVALGLVVTEKLEQGRDGSGAGPQVLIIVPTRELANQVSDELSWLFADLHGVRVESVTGGTPLFRERKMLARKPRVLVGTPGRLLDHVTTGVLDLRSVGELVLDEADQMLDMGFREELEGILEKTPESRRTHLVSATFPEGIQRLAKRYQRKPVMIEGTRLGSANQDISHEGHLIHPNDRYDALINLLLLAGEERTLVFVERRSDATELSERLEADGFSALPLSGELAQSQRERTVQAFRSGRANVLVATDVAARGLDVPDVATVIHTAPPLDSQILHAPLRSHRGAPVSPVRASSLRRPPSAGRSTA